MSIAPTSDLEIADDGNGIVLRRVVVGALDTNCWILFSPNDRSALIVDPGDEPSKILDAVGDLDVNSIILTHQHFDHVLALPEVTDALGVEIYAHPADSPVWPNELGYLDRHGHFDAGTATADLLAKGEIGAPADRDLWNGNTIAITHGDRVGAGNLEVAVLHTPGHTPGGICLLAGGHVLTGDTLFPGGPGLTGWPLSDFNTIIGSIKSQLFCLPGRTNVHPGHGASTTIGTELPNLRDWIVRGW